MLRLRTAVVVLLGFVGAVAVGVAAWDGRRDRAALAARLARVEAEAGQLRAQVAGLEQAVGALRADRDGVHDALTRVGSALRAAGAK